MIMVLSTLLSPSLLLADEITSALDVSSQKAVVEMLVGFRDLELVRSVGVPSLLSNAAKFHPFALLSRATLYRAGGSSRLMLELERVSKIYKVGTFGGKELVAVRDVSFQIPDGQVVSLIGESGCGKSTIGKMILRLISTSSGSILFDGVDVSSLKGRALKDYYRSVRGVFQDPFSS